MRTMLAKLGHAVSTAHDVEEGLRKTSACQYDVFICDIGLPGINGYDVARSIKNSTAMKNTFLVALTGYTEACDMALAFDAGFDRHLAKPADISVLKQILTEAAARAAVSE